MQRVMITGGPGSGKSTLARALGHKTGLPVHHMDHIHWRPGWIERDRDEKSALTRAIHAQDRWILEGGHSATYPGRVARADTFIWLDIPVALRLTRVLHRTLRHHGKNRPDLPEGCPEQFNGQTLEFTAFIWRTRKTSRAKLATIAATPPPHLKVIHLTSQPAIDRWLD